MKSEDKDHKKRMIIGAVVSVIIAIALFSVGSLFEASSQPPPLPDSLARDSTLHTVTFKVFGTAKAAAISYTNEVGGSTDAPVNLPWQITEKLRGDQGITLIATNGGYEGTLQLEVDKDGVVWRRTTGPNPTSSITLSSRLNQKDDN